MRTALVASAAVLAAFALTAQAPADRSSNERVIRAVFGVWGQQAVNVARCESGVSVWARNGQYLGAFQFGNYARARFGFGWDIWAQSRAAYAYFVASGYRFTPWTCGR